MGGTGFGSGRSTRLVCGAALFLALALLPGCSYLHYASVHASYEKSYASKPTTWVEKHSLRQPTYFVFGRLLNASASTIEAPALAVAALSSRYQVDEIADVNSLGKAQSYYGLNLPPGQYRLVVLADLNSNGRFENDEVVGDRPLTLDPGSSVKGGIDITITGAATVGRPGFKPFTASSASASLQPSLFYPKGALRSLDDPLFSPSMAQLGLYDPAAFIEAAPSMFYALEEDLGHKVPVIFVHGMGGSPAEFQHLVERLDRTRYKAWFYYYPSGSDLSQLAQLFHDIFLSGTVIPPSDIPLVIVAHSMGGLVVREALNQCAAAGCGNRVARFITIASPFGGEQSAHTGVRRAPFVPPAWHGLDPGGSFVPALFRNPLPKGTEHHLIFAYRNTADVARGTDGTVPVSSQLAPSARTEATSIHGLRSGHAEVLSDPAAASQVIDLVNAVSSGLSETQLRYLAMGGFDVPLGPAYSDLEKYEIRSLGHFLRALATGTVTPVHPTEIHFVKVVRGELPTAEPVEIAWLRFRVDYPAIAEAVETP